MRRVCWTKQTEVKSRGELTCSAVGVGIPSLFMEYQGAFWGYEPDKTWDFTVEWGRIGRDREKERKRLSGFRAFYSKDSRKSFTNETTLPLAGSTTLLQQKNSKGQTIRLKW